MGTPEGKLPICRFGDNIKIDLKVIECTGMDLIHVAQHRGKWKAIVDAVQEFRIPKNAGTFFTNGELLICLEVFCCTVLVGYGRESRKIVWENYTNRTFIVFNIYQT
jgi:hypothetical protein